MAKHRENTEFLLFTNGLILLAGAMLGPLYAIFVENAGGRIIDAGTTAAVFSFVGGITTLLSGRYSDDRRKQKIIVASGYLLMSAGFLLFLVAKSVIHVVLVQALIGFAQAMYLPAYDALYTKSAPKSKEGSTWALWESMNYFTTAVGAFVGGAVVSMFGFHAMFVIMAMLTSISGILVLVHK